MKDPQLKEILNDKIIKHDKWNQQEINLFKEAIKLYGVNYDKISKHIGSKTYK